MKVALLFPGQGSQYIGMGKTFFNNFQIVRDTFEEASETLNIDFRKLCFEGLVDELTKTENCQPAILTISVSAFRVYMNEIGVNPWILAGHSLGEYSALVCSGAMNFSDGLKLVRKRGEFMQQAVPTGIGSMAAISGIDMKVIEEKCRNYMNSSREVVSISNFNSKDQIVISGHKNSVEKISIELKTLGAKVFLLNVSAPFHCKLMQEAADRMNGELSKYIYNDFNYRVLSNVDANVYESKNYVISNLTKQITNSVRWIQSMNVLKDENIDLAIELGPKNILKNLMKKNVETLEVSSFEDLDDIKNLKNYLCESKNKYNTNLDLMKLIIKCMAVAVSTQNKNWNNDEYDKGVTQPYRKVKDMQKKLENEGRVPSYEDARVALDMLNSVFITKKTPYLERKMRMESILNDTEEKELFKDYICKIQV